MYKYILFDLDGTLTDSADGILNSVEYALNKMGVNNMSRQELFKFVGPPLHVSFSTFCGFDEEESERAVEYYREYFRDKGIFENCVYDGVTELLSTLKTSGKKLVIATSKPEVFTLRILKHFDLIKYFDFVAGATLDGTRSAKADVISYALTGSNIVDKSEAIMVGDRNHDIIGAAQNGLKSIGVTYGYGGEEELKEAGADFLAATPGEILKLVM